LHIIIDLGFDLALFLVVEASHVTCSLTQLTIGTVFNRRHWFTESLLMISIRLNSSVVVCIDEIALRGAGLVPRCVTVCLDI